MRRNSIINGSGRGSTVGGIVGVCVSLAMSCAMLGCEPEDTECSIGDRDEAQLLAEREDPSADVRFDIANGVYGPQVLRQPEIQAATCSVTAPPAALGTDADRLFTITCEFESCDARMSIETRWPDGLGMYTLLMRNPCH